MSTLKPRVAALTAGLAMLCTTAPAFCNDRAENDAIADLAAAKISLTEAIRIAEAHVGGRATSAELEVEGKRVVFEVEVVGGRSQVMEVTVDAVTGRVLASQQDPPDEHDDDDADEEDEQDEDDEEDDRA